MISRERVNVILSHIRRGFSIRETWRRTGHSMRTIRRVLGVENQPSPSERRKEISDRITAAKRSYWEQAP